jgi:hypothetical protein
MSLFPLGIALVLFAWAWTLTISDKVHTKWTIGLLLFPLVVWPVFAFRRWDIAGRAAGIAALGLAVVGLSVVMR